MHKVRVTINFEFVIYHVNKEAIQKRRTVLCYPALVCSTHVAVAISTLFLYIISWGLPIVQ